MNKFEFQEDLAGNLYINIDSGLIENIIEFIKTTKKNIYGVIVSHAGGYNLDNLDFLRSFVWIKGLMVASEYNDISGISYLVNLEYLQVSKVTHPLDLTPLKALTEYRGEWSSNIHITDTNFNLKTLGIRNYSGKNNDLEELSVFLNLTTLELVQSSVTSLNGIDKIKTLNNLVLAYCKNLSDISSISKLEYLDDIHFENCKKINSFMSLKTNTSLSTLDIEKSGKLDSLEFLTCLPKLKRLFFAGSVVLDQNLSFILKCTHLESLHFNNKKGYSHQLNDIKEILEVD